MPRRKPKKNNLSKEQELSLKDKLDGILLADEMLSGLTTPDIPPIKPPRLINIDGVKTEVESEARSILESLSNFYNDLESISPDSYIKHKQKIDALSISTMAFQIRTAQHAITKLLEEIDSGRIEPRLFEVLAQLQNQIMQMPKNFSAYMTEMEKNYKRLKSESEDMKKQGDLKIDGNGNIIQSPENIDVLKVRGTKTLMENLQSMIKNGQIVREAEIIEDNDLINPKKKDSVESDLLGGSNCDSDFEIEDEMF